MCEPCGLIIHAGHNAVINIHTLEQRGIGACGDGRLLPSVKQEPSGNDDRVSIPRIRGIPFLKEGEDVKEGSRNG